MTEENHHSYSSVKFPKMDEIEDWVYYHELYAYDINYWFQRCMAEFPNERDSPFLYNTDGMVEWFEKWFNQFSVNNENFDNNRKCDSSQPKIIKKV